MTDPLMAPEKFYLSDADHLVLLRYIGAQVRHGHLNHAGLTSAALFVGAMVDGTSRWSEMNGELLDLILDELDVARIDREGSSGE